MICGHARAGMYPGVTHVDKTGDYHHAIIRGCARVTVEGSGRGVEQYEHHHLKCVINLLGAIDNS